MVNEKHTEKRIVNQDSKSEVDEIKIDMTRISESSEILANIDEINRNIGQELRPARGAMVAKPERAETNKMGHPGASTYELNSKSQENIVAENSKNPDDEDEPTKIEPPHAIEAELKPAREAMVAKPERAESNNMGLSGHRASTYEPDSESQENVAAENSKNSDDEDKPSKIEPTHTIETGIPLPEPLSTQDDEATNPRTGRYKHPIVFISILFLSCLVIYLNYLNAS